MVFLGLDPVLEKKVYKTRVLISVKHLVKGMFW